jgi:hypothetical protein
MLIIDDLQALDDAMASSAAAVLALRRDLIDLATFIVVGPNDSLTSIEQATGFPIEDDIPPWEWVLDHGGVFEAPIITSDDGSGVVLIVPDSDAIDATLITLLRAQAEAASPID